MNVYSILQIDSKVLIKHMFWLPLFSFVLPKDTNYEGANVDSELSIKLYDGLYMHGYVEAGPIFQGSIEESLGAYGRIGYSCLILK